jgi:hypothetical protein
MSDILYTPQLFIFDVIVQTVILISILIMFVKTRELYNLSMQKGIKYLNNAMLFFLIGFLIRISTVFINFFKYGFVDAFEKSLLGLIFTFFNLYTSFLGGLFLAYCIIWRHFERDHFTHSKHGKFFMLNFFTFIIVIIDLLMMVFLRLKTPILFFSLIILILILAISMNCKHCKHKHIGGKNINPFISLVGLGLGVYLVLLIENLIYPFFFTIHYYTWGLSAVFTLAFLYHVMRVSK